MIARYATLIVAVLTTAPALGENLDADAARRFVVGKQFVFTCFDGSRGAGRIFGDGSVMGTIQVRGSGPVHSIWLPAGTLKVKGDAVCASLSGIPIEPCFDLDKMDDQSFRGSISGLDARYCEFTHLSDDPTPRLHRSGPLSLDPPRWRPAGPEVFGSPLTHTDSGR
jgi:hypothetical protein